MTDTPTPGSEWLLPVTYEKPGVNSQFFLTQTGYHVLFDRPEIASLIPASRLADLEAEVARLHATLVKIHDVLFAQSGADEHLLRQLVWIGLGVGLQAPSKD